MPGVGVELQAVPGRGCALDLGLRLSSRGYQFTQPALFRSGTFLQEGKYLNTSPVHVPGCATRPHFFAAPAETGETGVTPEFLISRTVGSSIALPTEHSW